MVISGHSCSTASAGVPSFSCSETLAGSTDDCFKTKGDWVVSRSQYWVAGVVAVALSWLLQALLHAQGCSASTLNPNYFAARETYILQQLFRLLEAQIASALPLSLEMLHRRTKSSLICLSTVLEEIIDSTFLGCKVATQRVMRRNSPLRLFVRLVIWLPVCCVRQQNYAVQSLRMSDTGRLPRSSRLHRRRAPREVSAYFHHVLHTHTMILRPLVVQGKKGTHQEDGHKCGGLREE